jgi:uncharacterized protein involved in exopolysaccharide biosynthesis/Mrp family chromosome partitioning ATPase
MQKSQSSTPKGGFNAHDILFVLFKHKWMILALSLIGLTAAGLVYRYRVPLFMSESKLQVMYVLQRENVDSFQNQSTPGQDPMNSVIGAEIDVLTSVDVAIMAAQKVGVEKILPLAGPNAAASDAANVILANFKVGPGMGSNVLHLAYANEKPALAKEILEALMDCYFEKHMTIHRSAASFEAVSAQTEEAKNRLKITVDELNKLRADSGILSLASANSAMESMKARTNEELTTAKAEYAEQEAAIKAVESAAERSAAENERSEAEKLKSIKTQPAPANVVTEYKTLVDLIAFLQKRQLDLQVKFKSGNRLLESTQQQMQAYEAKRRELAAKYPSLAQQVEIDSPGAGKGGIVPDRTRLAALSAKIEFFENNLRAINEQFSEQYAIGAKIEELERRKSMEETAYRSLEEKLKNAEIDREILKHSQMPNITVVQHPTMPIKSFDEKTTKIIFGLAGGGVAMGLGLAFLIEMLFSRKVSRPIEIQTRLQLPLLLSIPYVRRKERGGLLLGHDAGVPRIGSGEATTTALTLAEEPPMENPLRKTEHFILPYSETIRDRIIFNFEINNLTHKPKLVAVTGLSEGAGASTVAAGLAKSFSEIPGTKVLLVDLSSYHPEDNPLFGEIPRHSLNGALHLARNTKFREAPQNLYYASATARRDETGLTTFSPVHLYELMPHLQASQYDYIVFDMPPVDQTSRTLTMAGLMDKVLLVLDAENTSRDGLMWGYSELVKGRADVSCIFNKTRSHVPGWLVGEN